MAEMRLAPQHIGRCLNICYALSTGTTFLYSDEKGVVFITAAHVICAVQPGDNIMFRRPGEWLPAQVRSIALDDEGYDVGAFTLDGWQFAIVEQEKRPLGMFPGAEVKFLGFPHGLENSYPSDNGFCTPLVRTAFFSGVTSIAGQDLMILDGINNPGYSGGPIFSAQPDGSPTLVGIISGYRHERGEATQLFKRLPEGGDEPVPGYFLKPNSGMIYAVQKPRIIRLLERFSDRM